MAPQPTAAVDDCIFKALEPVVGDLAFRLTDAIWRALLTEGRQMTRIGRTFFDDTDEGELVLVIPLDRPAGRAVCSACRGRGIPGPDGCAQCDTVWMP